MAATIGEKAPCRKQSRFDWAVDLATLDDFLASDRTPAGCMQLSELDGFLAGIIVGPDMIRSGVDADEFWHDGEPVYADLKESTEHPWHHHAALNEIIRQKSQFSSRK